MSPQGNGTARDALQTSQTSSRRALGNHVDNESPLATGYTHLTGGYDGGQAQYNRVPYGE